MYCPSCGTELVKGATFCHHCGCSLEEFTPNLAQVEESLIEVGRLQEESEFSRYSDTASMYMDTLQAVRQQSFDRMDW